MDLSRLDVKDLTEPEKVDLCFKSVKALEDAVGKIGLMYREVGKLLEFMYQNKIYKHYSSNIEGKNDGHTWSNFIAEINIGIGVSQCDHLRRVSRTFEPYLENRNIKFKRLLDILPVVDDKNREDLLDAAESLPASGWNDAVRELKGKITTDTCLHERQESYSRCLDCGKWLRKEPTLAEWSGEACPKCGAPFVARDKFGLFCCVSGCGWKEKS